MEKVESIFSLRIRKDKVITTINETVGLGIAIAVMTLVYAFIIVPLITEVAFFSQIISLILILFVFLLSIGIYFKSRLCAVTLLIIYLIDAVLIFIFGSVNGLNPSAVTTAIIIHIFFFIFLLRGTKAVFIYHKYLKGKSSNLFRINSFERLS